MNALTLTYGSTTQTLAQWGFTNPRMIRRSRAAGTFEVFAPGIDPAANSTIPYLGQITVKDTSHTGSPVIFAGRMTDYKGSSQNGTRGVSITFSDAWWDLERTIYQVKWWTTTDGVTFTSYLSSRLWLFQNYGTSSRPTPWGYWTAAQQITDIISFAQTTCGINIQPGTIDPPIMMPAFAVTSQTCAQCINTVLQTLADASSAIDYTTTPPTLNIRIRQNCTPVTLPYADGVKHSTSVIKCRYDLQVPQVVINYRAANVTGGVAYTSFANDVYPAGSTGTAINAVIQDFDLRGSQRNYVSGVVTSIATDPTTTAFWKAVKPDLANSDISGLTVVGTPTVLDDSGSAVSLTTYPNRIAGNKKGGVAPWMVNGSGTQIVAKQVTISAVLSYTKNTADGHVIQTSITNHNVTYQCTLTNSAAGTQTYTALASAVAAESPPPNFAYLFWCSQNNVPVHTVSGVITPPGTAPAITDPQHFQWEGDHTIKEATISNYYDCTNTLNIDDSDGGNTSWASMAATIYEIEYDFINGTTRVEFGPHKTLSIAQFFSILMMARIRMAWDNPNLPSTGTDPAGAGVNLPTDTPKENTVEHSTPTTVTHGVIGPVTDGSYWQHTLDAGSNTGPFDSNAGRVMQVRNTSDGSIVTNSQQLIESMTDVDDIMGDSGFADTVYSILRFRPIAYKNADCQDAWRIVLCSQEFLGDVPDDPHPSDP